MATKAQRAEKREQAIKGSIAYESSDIPPYLCNAYSTLTETIVPNFLRTVARQGQPDLYYVYGGRAEAHYNPALLSADWDIIFNDTLYDIEHFAQMLLDFASENLLSISPLLKVALDMKYYRKTNPSDRGRIILQLVDPYMPYSKTYDIVDIAGCHDIHDGPSTKGNYCRQFGNLVNEDGIPYVSREFTKAERDMVIRKREHVARASGKAFMELFASASAANAYIASHDTSEELNDLLSAYEYIQSQIRLYLADSVKYKRTLHRSSDPQIEEQIRRLDSLMSVSSSDQQKAGGPKTKSKSKAKK